MTVATKNLPALEVHWGGPDGTQDLVVGYLEFDGNQWTFQYAENLGEMTRINFDGFSGLAKSQTGTPLARSSILFPAFGSRIPNLKRADVVRSAGDLTSLPREEALYEFLRRTGGRTGTDHIWFAEVAKRMPPETEGLGKPLRNEIRKMVAAIRRLLEVDIREQLEGTFGILPDGRLLDIAQVCGSDRERRCDREAIEAAIKYDVAGGRIPKEAVEQFTREVAFTWLNRFAALKMMEERGLIQESISKGSDSSGFRLFKLVCEEICRSHPDGGYQRYLELLCDDVAGEIKVLFDRSLPHSRIFPRAGALKDVLDLLNESCPPDVWKSDETIGWVYQYFNPKEEREAMRKASRSPRNTRELAVRNQFYTPRFVVEFLTDNTLGRTWFEMRAGNTRLKDLCRYLVQRPNEVFLAPGESAPTAGDTVGMTKEQVLKQPSYIPHRAKKDPRDVRILDPACGSGHFLLYAFDLLLVIYDEAWSDPDSPAFSKTGSTLREEYPDPTALQSELPRLILRHNLHGIDIDLRATQIAALALWLRAQRAYRDLGLKAAERPPIRRSNIVCAEPMPGNPALLDEFLTGLQPTLLRQLVRVIFDKMELAGEAGSLLKIEADIREALAEARKQWAQGPRHEQILLWPEAKRPKPEQGTLFDTRGITDETFWHDAEERVLGQLKSYAERAENGSGVTRSLFTEDAVQGLAFIDLCRNRYDAILMNPPFGASSRGSKEYIEDRYPNSKGDLLANFVERTLDLLDTEGRIGAISNRTPFFLGSFESFRSEVLGKTGRVRLLADLGEGVLEAMVETAVYVLTKSRGGEPESIFFRLLIDLEKGDELQQLTKDCLNGYMSEKAFIINPASFDQLGGKPYAYWVSEPIIQTLSSYPRIEGNIAVIRVGMQTGDDFRFLRCLWEVNPRLVSPSPQDSAVTESARLRCLRELSSEKAWVPFSKTDIASPWFSPITLVVKWAGNGTELRNFTDEAGNLRSRLQSEQEYFKPGFSYMGRCTRLVPYMVPAGVMPTARRAQIFPFQHKEYTVLAICASNVGSAVARFRGEKFAWPNFQAGMVQGLPACTFPVETLATIKAHVDSEVNKRRDLVQRYEPFQEFRLPAWIQGNDGGETAWDLYSLFGRSLETKIAEAFGLSSDQLTELERDIREAVSIRGPSDDIESQDTDDESNDDEQELNVELISETSQEKAIGLFMYLVGVVFGRWDVRIALDPSLAPKLSGPFDPLPVCPPGMLVGPDGLPAEPGRIASEEWIRARPDANTLPPEGSVKISTGSDADYPLTGLNWDGILVDDEGHPSDIVARVREVLRILWPDRADDVEREACEINGVKDLRAYFRNPRSFFTDHIKRYTKSQRKAPIYWLLQTPKRSYGLWLYYHRLTKDTLFHALRTYVEPKIQHEEARRHELRRHYEAAKVGKAGKEERRLVKEMEAQESLLSELSEFKANIEAVAYGRVPGVERDCRGWDPDLNDGVILNIAPLHAVVPWKDAEKTWKELNEGLYDWSHVAISFWPQRVEVKCKDDRSIAIAHGRGVE